MTHGVSSRRTGVWMTCILAVIAALVASSHGQLGSLREASQRMVQLASPNVDPGELESALHELLSLAYRHLAARTDEERWMLEAHLSEVRDRVNAMLQAGGANSQPDEAWRLLQQLRPDWQRATNLLERRMGPANERPAKDRMASAASVEEADYAIKRCLSMARAARAAREAELRRGFERFGDSTRRAQSTVLWMGAAGLLGALGAAAMVIRRDRSYARAVVEAIHRHLSRGRPRVEHLPAANRALATRISEFSGSIEGTNVSLTELTNLARRTAGTATAAKDLAMQVQKAAATSGTAIADMSQALTEGDACAGTLSRAAQKVEDLASTARALAADAAVEAAKAGDAGRGLGAVAEELRRWAESLTATVQEAKHQLEETQAKVKRAVVGGRRLAENHTELASRSRHMNELLSELATAVQEGSHGLTHVQSEVLQWIRTAHAASAGVQQLAGESEQIREWFGEFAQASGAESTEEIRPEASGGAAAVASPLTGLESDRSVPANVARADFTAPVRGSGSGLSEPTGDPTLPIIEFKGRRNQPGSDDDAPPGNPDGL